MADSRKERFLMRQRGAGRQLQDNDFGFSLFGGITGNEETGIVQSEGTAFPAHGKRPRLLEATSGSLSTQLENERVNTKKQRISHVNATTPGSKVTHNEPVKSAKTSDQSEKKRKKRRSIGQQSLRRKRTSQSKTGLQGAELRDPSINNPSVTSPDQADRKQAFAASSDRIARRMNSMRGRAMRKSVSDEGHYKSTNDSPNIGAESGEMESKASNSAPHELSDIRSLSLSNHTDADPSHTGPGLQDAAAPKRKRQQPHTEGVETASETQDNLHDPETAVEAEDWAVVGQRHPRSPSELSKGVRLPKKPRLLQPAANRDNIPPRRKQSRTSSGLVADVNVDEIRDSQSFSQIDAQVERPRRANEVSFVVYVPKTSDFPIDARSSSSDHIPPLLSSDARSKQGPSAADVMAQYAGDLIIAHLSKFADRAASSKELSAKQIQVRQTAVERFSNGLDKRLKQTGRLLTVNGIMARGIKHGKRARKELWGEYVEAQESREVAEGAAFQAQRRLSVAETVARDDLRVLDLMKNILPETRRPQDSTLSLNNSGSSSSRNRGTALADSNMRFKLKRWQSGIDGAGDEGRRGVGKPPVPVDGGDSNGIGKVQLLSRIRHLNELLKEAVR